MTNEMFILVIYSISLIAVIFCIWIKWIQEDIADKLKDIEAQYHDIQNNLEKLSKELHRLSIQNPLNRKK